MLSLAGLLLARKYVGGAARSEAPFNHSVLLRFGVPATLFSVMLFLIMSIDLFAVKRAIPDDVKKAAAENRRLADVCLGL